MLIRVVRLDFDPDKVDDFLNLFETIQSKISTFPGCIHLELCKDVALDHVYYTFSKWNKKEDLDLYLESELFKGIWMRTKILFGGKPLAYSLVPQ